MREREAREGRHRKRGRNIAKRSQKEREKSRHIPAEQQHTSSQTTRKPKRMKPTQARKTMKKKIKSKNGSGQQQQHATTVYPAEHASTHNEKKRTREKMWWGSKLL